AQTHIRWALLSGTARRSHARCWKLRALHPGHGEPMMRTGSSAWRKMRRNIDCNIRRGRYSPLSSIKFQRLEFYAKTSCETIAYELTYCQGVKSRTCRSPTLTLSSLVPVQPAVHWR